MKWNTFNTTKRRFFFKICLIFLCFIKVSYTLKILNIKVPTTYIIEQNEKPKTLILDCEYEIGDTETGFVLKWFFNKTAVYQWLTSYSPIAFSIMKNRIDTTYSNKLDDIYKYRALAITNPSWNLTGEYSCSVQTFESDDRRTAFLQIIVAETDFQLNYNVTSDGIVTIICSTKNIYPLPKLQIVLSDDHYLDVKNEWTRDDQGLYNSYIYGIVNKENLDSPTAINCILSIPGTNYTKKKETIYYDQVFLPTLQSKRDEMSSAIFKMEYASSKSSFMSNDIRLQHLFIGFVTIFYFKI